MSLASRVRWRWFVSVAVAAGLLLAAGGSARAVGEVLTYVETEYNGSQGPEGLDDAYAVAVSPDGLNVYVGGPGTSDGLAVFSRDALTGALTFIEVHYDGVAGVEGIGGIIDIDVSPDGKHVYTASVTDSSVAIFSRDAGTGALTYAGEARNGVGSITGLNQASGVVVASNNSFVYATGRFADGVVVFSRNTTSGALTFVEAEKGPGSSGSITTLDGPEDLVISPDGLVLMVASGASDSINVFARSPGAGVITFTTTTTDGASGVDGLNNVTSLAVSADGLSLYGAGAEDHKEAVFTRTLASGALNFVEVEADGVGGANFLAGAGHVVISPDSQHVYVSAFADDAVTVFTRSATTGALTAVSAARNNQSGVANMDLPHELALAPNGGQLYVAAANSDALSVFTRDSGTGGLAFFEHHVSTSPIFGLAAVNSIEVSPTGNTVYVASAAESAVGVFARDAATGVITFTASYKESDGGGSALLGGARDVAVSPNGSHFYIIGSTDNSIISVQRHSTFGTSLGVVNQLTDGGSGVDGMNSPMDVEVSPDNAHVYVASSGSDNAVTTFVRSQVNGSLTFTDTIKDGEAGATELSAANALALSTDGLSLYVTAGGDHAVTVFTRSPSTGLLTFLEVEKQGIGGLSSLEGANDVTLSPDQANVYITSADSSAVTVFSRDPATGALTYAEHETNSLSNPLSVEVSPDGHYVFVSNPMTTN